MKNIAILGSTGSIGTQTLEIVRENSELQVVALAAGSNVELMERQIREFRTKRKYHRFVKDRRRACWTW